MNKLSNKELQQMADLFGYKGLPERYYVMEKYFDIQEGSTVIDGGAFHSDMAIYFSKKVGSDGKVYSFEPLRINYEIMRNFITKHNLNNIKPLQIALWNKREKKRFYLSEYPNAGSLLQEFRKVGDEFQIAYANTLDNVVKRLQIKNIGYVWMNIECSEINALIGMKGVLENNNVQLIVSTHKIYDNVYTTDKVIKILEQYNYYTEKVQNHPMWIYSYKK